MNEQARDSSEELAEWLKDAGSRTWRKAPTPATNEADRMTESSAQLVGYLEELAGRKFRSRDDVRAYVEELSAQAQKASRASRRGQVLKDTVLLFCLLSAYIQYNFLDVNLQIARMPSTIIFVPVGAHGAPARTGSHARQRNAGQASAAPAAPAA